MRQRNMTLPNYDIFTGKGLSERTAELLFDRLPSLEQLQTDVGEDAVCGQRRLGCRLIG
jgi:hypothetical protein